MTEVENCGHADEHRAEIGVASSRRPTVPPILNISILPLGDGRSQRRVVCDVQASCISLPSTRQLQPLDSLRIKIPHNTLRPVVTKKETAARKQRKAKLTSNIAVARS